MSLKSLAIASIFGAILLFSLIGAASAENSFADDLNATACNTPDMLCLKDISPMFETAKANGARFKHTYVAKTITFAMPIDSVDADDTFVRGSYYLKFKMDADNLFGDVLHCYIRPNEATRVLDEIMKYDKGDIVFVSGTVEVAITESNIQLTGCDTLLVSSE